MFFAFTLYASFAKNVKLLLLFSQHIEDSTLLASVAAGEQFAVKIYSYCFIGILLFLLVALRDSFSFRFLTVSLRYAWCGHIFTYPAWFSFQFLNLKSLIF